MCLCVTCTQSSKLMLCKAHHVVRVTHKPKAYKRTYSYSCKLTTSSTRTRVHVRTLISIGTHDDNNVLRIVLVTTCTTYWYDILCMLECCKYVCHECKACFFNLNVKNRFEDPAPYSNLEPVHMPNTLSQICHNRRSKCTPKLPLEL